MCIQCDVLRHFDLEAGGGTLETFSRPTGGPWTMSLGNSDLMVSGPISIVTNICERK
jgi:hypothetical protein